MQGAIEYYLGKDFTDDYSPLKVEEESMVFNGENTSSGTNSTLTVIANEFKEEGDEKEPLSGTWTWDDSETDIGFYAVKADDQFALYFVYPGLKEGIWSTEHVENKGLSHLQALGITTTKVPEPAAMLLLGAGLILMGIVGRKQFQGKI